MFSGPWDWKDLNKEKNVKKFEKIARSVKEMQFRDGKEIRDGKMSKPFHYH